MATQTIDLGITGTAFQSNGIWQGAIPLDSAFIDGGGTAYLRVIQPVGNSIRVQLSLTDSGVPTDAGPEFTSSFESSNVALTFEDSASNSVTIGGPNTGTFEDPIEPYFWTPTNGPAMNTWFSGTLTGTIQVTLNDGIVGTSQTPIALSGSAAGTHTASLRVDVVADHTHIGVVPTYENELGRFVIMVGEEAKWYSDIQNSNSSFETIGTLESGSKVVWQTGDGSIGNRLAIDRIWWVDRSDSLVRDLRLNRSQLGQNYANQSNFNTYLTANPDTYIHFGTDHGTVSLPWSDRRSIGPHYINITPTADQIAILDQVAVGELVNVVISDGNTLDTSATVPSTPAAVTLTVDSDTEITATWVAPDDGGSTITSYDLRYRQTGTTGWTDVVDLTTTTHQVSGLSQGTEYEFQVRATNVAGDSGYSPSSTATIPAGVPDTPTSPALVANSASAITASWSAPSNNGSVISSYDLRYRETGTSIWTDVPDVTGTSRQVSGLSQGTEYEFQVRATNAVGDSGYSPSGTATTHDIPSTPAAPSVSAASSTSLSVSWVAPANGGSVITSYDLRYRETGTVGWSGLADQTGTTATISALTRFTGYDVQVRATNAVGDSGWSASGTATTQASVPDTPSAPTLVADNYSQITATWVAPANGGSVITSYDFRYRETGGASWTDVNDQTGTSYVIMGLTEITEYEAQVRATNAIGDGNYSASATITTPATATVPDPPSCPSAVVDGTSVEVSWDRTITISADVPTEAEIKIAYESNADTNAFTDALLTKLSNIAAGAQVNDVTQAELDAAFDTATINNGIITLTTIGGTSINLTIPTSTAMADGVVVSATPDATNQRVTLTTSEGDNIVINLSTLLSSFLNQSEVDARVTVGIDAHEGESNPHPTYATDADLAAHAATTHGGTASGLNQTEVDARVQIGIGVHDDESDAHHAKYTDAEADARARARYTDAEKTKVANIADGTSLAEVLGLTAAARSII